MNRILSNLLLILLMITLAVACQKEEIATTQPTDTLEVRTTLAFDIPTLWIIHDDLQEEVTALIDQGFLNPPNGNGLTPQLNNLKRAIERAEEAEEEPVEANQMLEEDIITHLAGLRDDEVLTNEQYEALYNIATNQVNEGTVILGGVEYHWKIFNGKKWLTENLRYPTFDGNGNPTYWFYPEDEYPEGINPAPDLYGMLYTQPGASAACAALAAVEDGWHLPTNQEWSELGSVYGLWENGENAGAYQALVDPMHSGNEDASGFNALLGGSRADWWGSIFFIPLNEKGYYWASDGPDSDNGYYFIFDKSLERVRTGLDWNNQGNSCRCVCNVE